MHMNTTEGTSALTGGVNAEQAQETQTTQEAQAPAQAAPGQQATGIQATGQQAPADWRVALPEDLRSEPSLQTIHDINALAKSYVSAQKMIGRPAVGIPDKHATEDDWKAVFNKLGNPEKVEDYDPRLPEGSSFDPEFLDNFKQAAWSHGVLPKQASSLLQWYNNYSQSMVEKATAQAEEQRQANTAALKQEWGEAFSQNLALAQDAARHVGDDALLDALDETGAGDNPAVIKAFAKIGQMLREDKVIGENVGEAKSTPAEALKKAQEILGDAEHPYHNKQHPNHKRAVEEVQAYYRAAYPESPRA